MSTLAPAAAMVEDQSDQKERAKDKVACLLGSGHAEEEEGCHGVFSIVNPLEDIQALPASRLPQFGVPGAHAVRGPYRYAVTGPGRSVSSENPQAQHHEDQLQVSSAQLVVETDEENGIMEHSSSNGDAPTEVIEGKLMERQETHCRFIGWLLVFGCVLVLVVLLIFLIPVFMGEEGSADMEPVIMGTSNPTQEPHRQPALDIELPEVARRGIEEDAESPFFKAAQWLLHDPNYHLYSQEQKRQRFYLSMLYYATNGASWTNNSNWLSYETSECLWFARSSFPADSPYYEPNICQNGTVINLSLASNNLTGDFPLWYTSFLPKLKILDFGQNRIAGQLPTMTSISSLEVVIMSNNPLTGAPSISSGAMFDNLRVLKVDGTFIRGNNGGALPYITPKLEVFNCTAQPNDGLMWSSIGVLTNLQYLGWGHRVGNHGSIPTELGRATSLTEIDISSMTKLEGSIPSELGLLTHLAKLDISDTPITGAVPAELCHRIEDGLLELSVDCGDMLQCCPSSEV
ncbi:Leucine Rich Repeat [Seminavis robusta]|uniref:Leucine Rich Repeat n=1 Tax=Seminavis robusta TaxID=568900 RepID=A0A9N8EYN3_9STRA|nr:Leucine Rich Repeat [Seminavis robusta]|eukprot:Sro2120_g315390.1 Leucine Rich Repeat (516) ;mRNA; f:3026-4573